MRSIVTLANRLVLRVFDSLAIRAQVLFRNVFGRDESVVTFHGLPHIIVRRFKREQGNHAICHKLSSYRDDTNSANLC